MRNLLLTVFLLTLVNTKIMLMEVEDLRELLKDKNRTLTGRKGHKGWFWSSEPTPDPSPANNEDAGNNSAPVGDADEDEKTPEAEDSNQEDEQTPEAEDSNQEDKTPEADDGNDSQQSAASAGDENDSNQEDQAQEADDGANPDDDGGEHDSNAQDDDQDDTDNLDFVPEERGEAVGHQIIKGVEEPLWPALCETKNHGLQWGKHDGRQAFYTIAQFSVKCNQPVADADRSDLEAIDFDPENPVSPCEELVATSKRGRKAYPVLVHSVHGVIPGKVLVKDLKAKGGEAKGYFGYDGKAFQGKLVSWLC